MTIGFTTGNDLSQTQIVSVMYDVPVTQVEASNPDCDRPAGVEEINTVFEEYGVSFEYERRALSYEDLWAELDVAPIELGIRWPDGGMHAVVAYGYNTNGKSLREVLIRDPDSVTAPIVTVDYDDLLNGGYGVRAGGTWVDTFWKLRKVSPTS
jgi:hypothetical protein